MRSRWMVTETAAKRAEGYRRRAEELRTIAGDMNSHEAKVIVLHIAADYQRMAADVELFGRVRPTGEQNRQA
jgi:hypothetical protein